MKTPIRLINITLRNFLSYGNDHTTISLEFSDPTLIIGRNLDAAVNGLIDSNGAGKTTIVNALAWCLYNKPISDISQDGLINFINKKNMEVTVRFEKDGDFYKVIRYRKHKLLGGEGIRIYKSDSLAGLDHADTKDIAPDSIKSADKFLVDIIGMPFEIFSRIVIYSARSKPFFDLSGPEQTEIMEELTGLTELGRWADILSEETKANNKQLESLKDIQLEIDNQKAKYTEKVDSIKFRVEQWDTMHQKSIKDTKTKLAALQDIDFEFQSEGLKRFNKINEDLRRIGSEKEVLKVKIANLDKELESAVFWRKNYEESLTKAQNKLDSFEPADYESEEKILNKLEVIRDEVKENTQKLNEKSKIKVEYSKRQSEIADQIEHLSDNKCPYCHQDYQEAKNKIASLEDEKSDLYAKSNEIEKETKKLASRISDDNAKIDELKAQARFTSLVELNNHRNSYKTLQKTLDDLNNTTNPFEHVDEVEIPKEIDRLNKDLQKLNSNSTKMLNDHMLLQDVLLYESETVLGNDMNKLETLKDELARLEATVNPHVETLNDMETMTFDDSNYQKIEALEDDIKHQKMLHKLLSKKDSFIRKSLLSKNLIFLNERLKDYMDMLGMPHRVKFTEELTASISQYGTVLGFGNLSAGQQARVNLALSFAFKDVMQKRYGKISFSVLDECLDIGLGSIGVQMAAKMVKAIAVKDKLSMFVISHKDEITNLFPNVLEIELRGGFSHVLPSKIVSIKTEDTE